MKAALAILCAISFSGCQNLGRKIDDWLYLRPRDQTCSFSFGVSIPW